MEPSKIWETLYAVGIASVGGLARYLNQKDRGPTNPKSILVKVFTSGFVGAIALLGARSKGISGDWLGFICGISGWMGVEFLNALTSVVTKAFGVTVKTEASTPAKPDDQSIDDIRR